MISFDDRVAIITGAGGGLGRTHALALASRGARIVVNDLGGDVHGDGGSLSPAMQVVEEIQAAGGEAIANGANVADADQVDAMVSAAMERWGRIDIVVNNAGILRDKSFVNMDLVDFSLVMDVHLMGAVHTSKAVWPIMRDQAYGRIVNTTSSSGLYGNFGQANYSAAKMALVGLMNTLALEGAKYNIKVNCLAPAAGTRMTEGLIPDEAFDLLTPEAVSVGLVWLVSDDAPTKFILGAGTGGFARTYVMETAGIGLGGGELTPEGLAASFDALVSTEGATEPGQGAEQTMKLAQLAMSSKETQ